MTAESLKTISDTSYGNRPSPKVYQLSVKMSVLCLLKVMNIYFKTRNVCKRLISQIWRGSSTSSQTPVVQKSIALGLNLRLMIITTLSMSHVPCPWRYIISC